MTSHLFTYRVDYREVAGYTNSQKINIWAAGRRDARTSLRNHFTAAGVKVTKITFVAVAI